MEPQIARCLLEKIRKTARFLPGDGAICPLCDTAKAPVISTKGSVRYHVCRECGWNFKSVEAKDET